MSHCIACKHGELKEGKTTFTAERDGVVVVVRNVSTLICGSCEEEYFEGTVTDELLNWVNRAIEERSEVAIREYSAA